MLINKGYQMSWEDYTVVEKLQCEWSDLHKDFHGFRPRWASEEQWNSEVFLEKQIKNIHDAIQTLKKSFAGREELRTMGWQVEETHHVLAQRAKWLAEEREREINRYYDEMESV